MKRAKKFSKKAVNEFVRTYCQCVTNDVFIRHEWIDEHTCVLRFKSMIYSSVMSNIPSNWSFYVGHSFVDGSNLVLTIYE